MATRSLSLKELQGFAEQLQTQVLSDLSEIKHDVNLELVDWCSDKDGILVLNNGDILAANPISPDVNLCQQYLKFHDLPTGKVYPTTLNLINLLKNQALHSADNKSQEEKTEGEKQLKELMHQAILNRASDIHMLIKPNTKECNVKFRINGLLQDFATWTAEEGLRAHSVAYNYLSQDKLDTFNQVKPQDMSFTIHFEEEGDVRVRSLNIGTQGDGTKIVYRLLSIGKKQTTPLEELGYTKEQEQMLRESRYYSNGLVLFCGETGSGKTTSLASVLAGIDRRKQVYSIEDPVEKLLGNVDQIPTDPRDLNKSFAYYLRALLRADPDVIMIGEIRDKETANVAIQAALTGHLIYSTLHTRFAVDSILRLSELGISPTFLATPNLIKLIVAQELHPVLCPSCKRKLNEQERESVSDLYSPQELDLIYTKTLGKCQKCRGEGIIRRKVYAEALKVDKHAHDFIAEVNTRAWSKYLKEHGFVTLQERIRIDLLKGEIDALNIKSLEAPEVDEFKYSD